MVSGFSQRTCRPRVERGVGDGGVVAGRRRDVDEVEAPVLRGQEREVAEVETSVGQIVARAIEARSAWVGDRDDLERAFAGTSITIRWEVTALCNGSVPDDGTAQWTHLYSSRGAAAPLGGGTKQRQCPRPR